MKKLNIYINEALKLGKSRYKYHPETKVELKKLMNQLIEERGNEGNFNDIDTSKITDMSGLFLYLGNFNGDISKWNVSNVTNMACMFYNCTSFNQDISDWVVSNVTNMNKMFFGCKSFNKDISNWNISNVKDFTDIFSYCGIEKKYKLKI